ncbi:protein arginine N-methyltransferase 7-like [Clytia hemisphaerica]|uniref:Protein arginine N-methyltransferase n=1 Tax=Clytia hemisphaerica TaxID=252671 RepID=A0A7M5V5G2_9CNID
MDSFDSGNESEENDEIARSAHAGMLHDHERHLKFNQALKETLAELSKTKNSIQVLDIGTGTSILSMMAASHSEKVKVVACEMFQPIAELAREIITDNGFEQQIKVLNKSSTEMTIPEDLPRKADVLVTEILDSELIGEGMLPTVNDAHLRLLSKDAMIIPAAAQVCIQLVESESLWEMNNLDEKNSGLKLPKHYQDCRRTANAHEIQCSQLYPDHIKVLSNSCICTEIDFTSVYKHNDTAKQSKHQILVKVTKTGILHGIVMWWDLIVHKEKDIILSMAPSWVSEEYIWRDHWMQCLYFLPKPIEVISGESLQVTMYHDNYTVWFDVVRNVLSSSNSLQPPICHCNLHVAWSRETFALWNTKKLIEKWRQLGYKLSKDDKRVVIVGDSSLAALVLKNNGFENVAYSESSKWTRSIIKGICDANNVIFPLTKVNHETDTVVYDPFWPCNILPWHILQIWHDVFSLSQKGVQVYPSMLYLKAAVVKFQELYKIRSTVGDILGFDLTKFDDLISKVQCVYSDPEHGQFYSAEPYSMIEYQHSIASDIVTLMDFNLTDQPPSKDILRSVTIKLDTEFSKEMALVVWLDSVYSEDITFTTGLTSKHSPWVQYSKQAVVFIPGFLKKELSGSTTIDCTVLYRPGHDHDVVFSFSRMGF